MVSTMSFSAAATRAASCWVGYVAVMAVGGENEWIAANGEVVTDSKDVCQNGSRELLSCMVAGAKGTATRQEGSDHRMARHNTAPDCTLPPSTTMPSLLSTRRILLLVALATLAVGTSLVSETAKTPLTVSVRVLSRAGSIRTCANANPPQIRPLLTQRLPSWISITASTGSRRSSRTRIYKHAPPCGN